MRVVAARPAEYVAALELLVHHLPPDEALARSRAALNLLGADADGSVRLLVARDGSAVAGAMLVEMLPGRTGVVWPPRAVNARLEDALVRDALSWFQRLGAKVIQAVLPSDELPFVDPLERAGFARVTELISLSARPRPSAVAGDFVTYADCRRDDFHATLLRSFEGGRDFPELDGRRSLADVLHGHQAIGYDPRRWWRLGDVGVLILAEIEPGAWSIAYIGVVPECRRRGHGRTLVTKALGEAHAASVGELSVGVDARNGAALALYEAAGFCEVERGHVYLQSR